MQHLPDSPEAIEYRSASDTRLLCKALREGWPMSDEKRAEAIAHLEGVVAGGKARPSILKAIQAALLSASERAKAVNTALPIDAGGDRANGTAAIEA